MKRKISIAVVLALVVALAGCAQTGIKPWTELPGIQKADFVVSWYVHAFQAHETSVKAHGLSPEKIRLLNQEADILDKARPYVALYAAWQKGGPVPGSGADAAIQGLMVALTQLQ